MFRTVLSFPETQNFLHIIEYWKRLWLIILEYYWVCNGVFNFMMRTLVLSRKPLFHFLPISEVKAFKNHCLMRSCKLSHPYSSWKNFLDKLLCLYHINSCKKQDSNNTLGYQGVSYFTERKEKSILNLLVQWPKNYSIDFIQLPRWACNLSWFNVIWFKVYFFWETLIWMLNG